ncbi:MFS transporter [Actinomadura nitritigenes]|uniref:MFS transporter n=1 Tax=Actinomadura nitritigenes TaxID=134602 RepID=UPI003D8F9CAB
MPLRPFHLRTAAIVSGGTFIDGYLLGAVIFAFPAIPAGFGMNSWWDGLVAAAPLLGVVIGGIAVGWLTDHVGRQRLFTLDLLLLLVGSALQLFASGPAQLGVVRLVLGLAVGADYAIGPALLAEFTPRKLRSSVMSSLNALWAVGYLAAAVIGYVIVQEAGDDGWRWALASSAVPAAAVLLMRVGAPESPRWLISKGRGTEARAIVDRWLGPDVSLDEAADTAEQRPWRELFGRAMWRRTLVGGLFWTALAVPNFSLFVFLPDVLNALDVRDEFWGTVLPLAFAVLGSLLGLAALPRLGRRPALLYSMGVLAVLSLWVGLLPGPAWLTIIVFVLFAVVLALAGNLEFIYPSELFPTALRASGLGVTAAISRVGAAAGTFLLPVMLDHGGVGAVMVATAATLLLGMVFTAMWAPETNGVSLEKAGATSATEGRPTTVARPAP